MSLYKAKNFKSIEEQLADEAARGHDNKEGKLKASLRIRAERLLLLLLFHPPSEWLHRTADGAVIIRAGALATILRWKSIDIYIHLDHLGEQGYLERYERAVGRGLTLIKCRPPVGMHHV